MPFTTAFHTYFLVSDVDNAHVDLGSDGLSFQDNTKGRAESKMTGSSVKFQQEFDAIFVGAPDTVKVCFQNLGFFPFGWACVPSVGMIFALFREESHT